MAKSAARIGIDLEQSSVAGAQVVGSRQGRSLTRAAVRALPPGVMFEGEVVDVERLADELKSFWKSSGFTGKRFSLGVANQKVVVRTMDFPVMAEKELRAAIEYQAQEAIPIPLADAILDFDVLATGSGDDGTSTQKVLIVAAQRDMVKQFVDAAHKAGLTIDNIDLQAFALMRSLAPPVAFVDWGAQGGGEATALVNISPDTTNLVVAFNGTPQFTRVVNTGCEALVQALMASHGITHDEADILRLNAGLSGSEPTFADLEPGVLAETREVLDNACEAFADEIRRSIDYYHSQGNQGRMVNQLLLSGEGALTRNMCDYLRQALRLNVALGNPLQHFTENKTDIPQSDLEAVSPRLAVALGLALDGEE
jgi:type IV pilus assembly protein PilM